MALETRTGTGATYLQLDFGRKSMYIYSADEKEGFEKHTSSSGKVSYRQYVNAVSGKITGAYFRDGNFGQEMVLVFTDGDEKYSLQIAVGDSVFTNLARSVENIDITKNVRLAIYESEYNNKSYFGTSLSYPDELNADGKAKFVEWGDELPKGKQLRSGKWDFSEQNDEAYFRFEEFIKKNEFDKNNNQNNGSNNTTESSPEPTSGNSKSPEIEDEDLPF